MRFWETKQVEVTTKDSVGDLPQADIDRLERWMSRAAKKMADDMMAALCGANAFTKQRPTALRLKPCGGFEVVELYEDGSIIEPPKPCPRCGPVLMCSECMARCVT